MLNKTCIHWLICCLCIPAAYSQKLVFENLGVRQGLPATEVYNLFQDRQGYVWVFTEYGIVKHNGSTFIPVCTNIPLKECAVYAVAESADGELYMANSLANIYRISNDSAFRIIGMEKETEEMRKTSQLISGLFIDNASTIFVSTFEKTYTFPVKRYTIPGISAHKANKKAALHAPERQFYAIKQPDPVTGQVHVKITDADGRIRDEFYRNWRESGRVTIRKHSGNRYVSSGREMNLYRKDGTVKVHYFDYQILNFELASDGHVWVALSGGGLLELDAELNLLEHYLDDIIVSDVLLDDQAGMWISTIGEGVYYCPNTDHLSYGDIPELSEAITVLKKIGGKLFIGTAGGNLFVREKGTLRKIELNGNKSYINDVIDFEGKYFVGTKGKIRIIGSDFRYERSIDHSGYAFRKENDHSLVIVTASMVIRKWKNSDNFQLLCRNIRNRCLAQRAPGEFFVITPQGLFRLQSTFTCPDYLKELQGKNISRLKTDSRKNIWICTKGDGLYCLTPQNKLVHYTRLPSEIINDVSFIFGDVVLLSTNKGAFVTTLKNLGIKSAWRLLLDEETMRMERSGNEVMIGTTSGLTALDARKLFKYVNYRFYLESVMSGNRKIRLNRGMYLNHRQNDLYFNFDLLAYRSPTKKLYYRLVGPSAVHGVVDGTQVHLQNLSPGHYTLYAYPHMNLVYGKKMVIIAAFYIQPAFWQTRLFFGLVICVGLVLVITSSWWIMYRSRKKQERRMQIEKLLTEYRLTALKAQVNPHFMSNSLVAIQQLILENETDKANQYIAKFSLLIRYLLNYSDQSVTSLRNELKIIDLYVELEQLRFCNQFLFISEIDNRIKTDQLYIPTLITQPLIENAIWHGLLPLTGQRVPQLTLTISIDQDSLNISIIDNGIGRTVQPLFTGEQSNTRESKGTQLIANRIENLNRLYATNGGRIEFIDRVDEYGNPTGTTVSLIFPLEMLNKLYNESNQEYYH